MNVKVEIDNHSGFCFGVVTAIHKAEGVLSEGKDLACLGEIVHNNNEVQRLGVQGLKTITTEEMESLKPTNILFRAHGEPPSVYQKAELLKHTVVDATCPVVLKLQQRIRAVYERTLSQSAQIVIYGKKGHAEVNGLVGQTQNQAIVIEHKDELEELDFGRDIYLFSQTTKSIDKFQELVQEIELRMEPGVHFSSYDTICRQVANRIPHLRVFVTQYDVVLFVTDPQSSNGAVLFKECQKVNPDTYLVYHLQEELPEKVWKAQSIGICGATSTPLWLMKQLKEKIEEMLTHPNKKKEQF